MSCLSPASQRQERSLQAERHALWFLPLPWKEDWLYNCFILLFSFINSIFLSQMQTNRDGSGEVLMPFLAGEKALTAIPPKGTPDWGSPFGRAPEKSGGVWRGSERWGSERRARSSRTESVGARPAHEGARSSRSPAAASPPARSSERGWHRGKEGMCNEETRGKKGMRNEEIARLRLARVYCFRALFWMLI